MLISLALLLLCLPSEAQWYRLRRSAEEKNPAAAADAAGRDRPHKPQVPEGTPMFYEVFDGDTVYMDVIDPVWVFPRGRKMKGNDWRKDYKLVYNFNKVYPYALAGRRMMAQVDSTIAADVTRSSERNSYTHDVMMELFHIFEKDIRSMTVSQGMLLMRLVDRECGMPPYEIIRTYRSGFTASFWQMVAKLFGADLKKRYEPTGMDKKTEQLVRIWDSGAWEGFYYSIYFEYPKKTVIARDYLQSTVSSRKSARETREAEEKEAGIMRRALETALED
ncbi:MAG: DUF4294 domain-containing protein [Bacteroidales bacterium]|nr:DUF4294 domain-containing protein [Bacteroidales bacterium]